MNHATTIVLAACAALVTACTMEDPIAPQPAGQALRLSASDQAAVKRGLRNSLKDPSSAQFGPMNAAVAADGTITVCGYVNGRNSFGGYTGMQPYLGVYSRKAGLFAPASFGSDKTGVYVVMEMCRRRGAPI